MSEARPCSTLMERPIRDRRSRLERLIESQPFQQGQQGCIEREISTTVAGFKFDTANFCWTTGQFCQGWITLQKICRLCKKDLHSGAHACAVERSHRETLPQSSVIKGRTKTPRHDVRAVIGELPSKIDHGLDRQILH